MKLNKETTLEEFAVKFINGRIIWRNIPKLGITNFGTIISMLLFRQPPFQVELFIVPLPNLSFPAHRHPDVDTFEFGLCGHGDLFVDGNLVYNREQINQWLQGKYKAKLISIKPTNWHSGQAITPYAFLSLQKWLNNVDPTSVGINWEGESLSPEQDSIFAANSR